MSRKRKIRSVPEIYEDFRALTDSSQLCHHGFPQLLRILRSKVAQSFVLEPTPNRLDRVEHRRVRRQPLQFQARCESLDGSTNRVALMHRASVPDYDHATRDLSHQHFQKSCRTVAAKVIVDKRSKEQ